MKIEGLTVCVDFADYLAATLPRWAKSLDQVVVVTAPRDQATQHFTRRFDNVLTVTTDVFWDRGADFNKGAGLNVGLAECHATEWVLAFDVDVLPPWDWRDTFVQAEPKRGILYGAKRAQTEFTTRGWVPDDWSDLPILGDRQVAGYFQLFHGDDPEARSRPLFEDDWRHAGNYDTSFQDRWGAGSRMDRKIFLPLVLAHLGLPQVNWYGVRPDALDKLAHHREERRKRAGRYDHERIQD